MQSSFSHLFFIQIFQLHKGLWLAIILVDETLSLSIHAKQFLLLLWFVFTLSLFPLIFFPIFSILYPIGPHSSVFSISLHCVKDDEMFIILKIKWGPQIDSGIPSKMDSGIWPEKLSWLKPITTLTGKHYSYYYFQFSSVTQLCPTLCNPMNHSTPGLPVHHQLPEFTQTRVHRVSDAIQSSHPRSSPSPPAPNPSQHQSLFQWVNSSHEVAKLLEFQL